MKSAARLRDIASAPEARDPIERAISRALEPLAASSAPTEPLFAAVRSLCARGGKRIRPRLCALAYEGVAGRAAPPGVYSFAAGIELLHAFMLVHDDLIDESDARRGGPSVHAAVARATAAGVPARQATDLAMLGGDLLFTLASGTMCTARMPAALVRRAMAVTLESARDAAVGECLDVIYSSRPLGSLASADLAEVLRLKTARYTFEAPLVAGAILARGSEATSDALASFGIRVGVAFQLADDLLDLFGDAAQLGKPTGGDVRQKKRTVLMRIALERAAPADAAALVAILESGTASDDEVAWVAALAIRTGAAAETVLQVRRLVRAAQRALRAVPLATPAREALFGMAGEVSTSVRGVLAVRS